MNKYPIYILPTLPNREFIVIFKLSYRKMNWILENTLCGEFIKIHKKHSKGTILKKILKQIFEKVLLKLDAFPVNLLVFDNFAVELFLNVLLGFFEGFYG